MSQGGNNSGIYLDAESVLLVFFKAKIFVIAWLLGDQCALLHHPYFIDQAILLAEGLNVSKQDILWNV